MKFASLFILVLTLSCSNVSENTKEEQTDEEVSDKAESQLEELERVIGKGIAILENKLEGGKLQQLIFDNVNQDTIHHLVYDTITSEIYINEGVFASVGLKHIDTNEFRCDVFSINYPNLLKNIRLQAILNDGGFRNIKQIASKKLYDDIRFRFPSKLKDSVRLFAVTIAYIEEVIWKETREVDTSSTFYIDNPYDLEIDTYFKDTTEKFIELNYGSEQSP